MPRAVRAAEDAEGNGCAAVVNGDGDVSDHAAPLRVGEHGGFHRRLDSWTSEYGDVVAFDGRTLSVVNTIPDDRVPRKSYGTCSMIPLAALRAMLAEHGYEIVKATE